MKDDVEYYKKSLGKFFPIVKELKFELGKKAYVQNDNENEISKETQTDKKETLNGSVKQTQTSNLEIGLNKNGLAQTTQTEEENSQKSFKDSKETQTLDKTVKELEINSEGGKDKSTQIDVVKETQTEEKADLPIENGACKETQTKSEILHLNEPNKDTQTEEIKEEKDAYDDSLSPSLNEENKTQNVLKMELDNETVSQSEEPSIIKLVTESMTEQKTEIPSVNLISDNILSEISSLNETKSKEKADLPKENGACTEIQTKLEISHLNEPNKNIQTYEKDAYDNTLTTSLNEDNETQNVVNVELDNETVSQSEEPSKIELVPESNTEQKSEIAIENVISQSTLSEIPCLNDSKKDTSAY